MKAVIAKAVAVPIRKLQTQKKMVMSIVNFIQDQDYENCEEFVNTISKSVLKKLQNPV